ncbi:MAG: copper homeostasis protein CutC [Bacteroidetes bacterium]|nr:copper homeostasis protein CutC [Bacteroidota bacterium]
MEIELCVASIKALRFAKNANIDRIELCQNLEVGGLTPSMGLVHMALDTGLETHVLIRPRLGGFFYSEEEFNLILNDIELFQPLDVKGFVVGFYNKEKLLDEKRLEKVRNAAGNKDLTFHRAFDDLADWKTSIDILHKHGFKRILTSGLASTIDAGLQQLPLLIESCQGKLEVMAGGGVNAKNLSQLVSLIKPNAIHFSGTQAYIDIEDTHFNVPRLEINEEIIKSFLEKIIG